MSEFVGKKTKLACWLTKPLAPYELIGDFWNQQSDPPRVVFVLSMPRSGSTLTQQYLGDHPNIVRETMSSSHNWWDAWVKQRIVYPAGRTVLDKRTKYLPELSSIIEAFGRHVAILLLIRDPRDVLLSLREYPDRTYGQHPEYPLGDDLFPYWSETYRKAISRLENWGAEERYRVLLYESLIRHPRRVKENFLDWINLKARNLSADYRPALHNRLFNALGIHMAADRKAVEQPSIVEDSLQRWRRHDSDAPLEAWRNHPEARALMEACGYLNDGAKDSPARKGSLLRPRALVPPSGG